MRVILFAVLLVLSAPAAAEDTLVHDGEILAVENCARCHAIADERESPHKDAPPFRSLSERYPVETLAEALAEGIVSGHPDMPELTFAPDEVEALIAYLQSVQAEQPGSTPE